MFPVLNNIWRWKGFRNWLYDIRKISIVKVRSFWTVPFDTCLCLSVLSVRLSVLSVCSKTLTHHRHPMFPIITQRTKYIRALYYVSGPGLSQSWCFGGCLFFSFDVDQTYHRWQFENHLPPRPVAYLSYHLLFCDAPAGLAVDDSRSAAKFEFRLPPWVDDTG